MKILALEFSSPQRSVAVLARRGSSSEVGHNEPTAASEIIETGQKSNPIGMIDSVLRQAQIEREQVDCIAVGLGPGSYTGIRLAIAIAQGWQLASRDSIKLLGISSAEALAAEAQSNGFEGRCHIVIDAQRGEFYAASYEVGADGLNELVPLKLASLAELKAREAAGEQILGPEVRKWFPDSRIIFPRAATVARLAFPRRDFISGENLQPIYLREPTFIKSPPSRSKPPDS
jgi:tRNA threonylcarbamoyladenosine biosynthesis protein TsaB